MILVNTDYIAGKNLGMLGLVKGSTIQSKHVCKDIIQGFKTIIGGELKAYTEMMNEANMNEVEKILAHHDMAVKDLPCYRYLMSH